MPSTAVLGRSCLLVNAKIFMLNLIEAKKKKQQKKKFSMLVILCVCIPKACYHHSPGCSGTENGSRVAKIKIKKADADIANFSPVLSSCSNNNKN